MPGLTRGRLQVAGASLYFERRGSGPPVLLIPTGNGDCGPYAPLATLLSAHHTVISYDRRGFSRSRIEADAPGGDRVATDAADAAALLKHLGAQPAHIFGGSSGAIVTLALLQDHPACVAKAVAHEPPLATVLPDAASWLAYYDDLYKCYREHGVQVARESFRNRMGMHDTTRPPPRWQPPPRELDQMLERIRRNQEFWFEQELRSYPAHRVDLAVLAARVDQLVLAGGQLSREYFPYRPNVALAAVLGTRVVDFPGGHVGYVTHPEEFAEALRLVLAAS